MMAKTSWPPSGIMGVWEKSPEANAVTRRLLDVMSDGPVRQRAVGKWQPCCVVVARTRQAVGPQLQALCDGFFAVADMLDDAAVTAFWGLTAAELRQSVCVGGGEKEYPKAPPDGGRKGWFNTVVPP